MPYKIATYGPVNSGKGFFAHVFTQCKSNYKPRGRRLTFPHLHETKVEVNTETRSQKTEKLFIIGAQAHEPYIAMGQLHVTSQDNDMLILFVNKNNIDNFLTLYESIPRYQRPKNIPVLLVVSKIDELNYTPEDRNRISQLARELGITSEETFYISSKVKQAEGKEAGFDILAERIHACLQEKCNRPPISQSARLVQRSLQNLGLIVKDGNSEKFTDLTTASDRAILRSQGAIARDANTEEPEESKPLATAEENSNLTKKQQKIWNGALTRWQEAPGEPLMKIRALLQDYAGKDGNERFWARGGRTYSRDVSRLLAQSKQLHPETKTHTAAEKEQTIISLLTAVKGLELQNPQGHLQTILDFIAANYQTKIYSMPSLAHPESSNEQKDLDSSETPSSLTLNGPL